jgi:hypothetical protein
MLPANIARLLRQNDQHRDAQELREQGLALAPSV